MGANTFGSRKRGQVCPEEASGRSGRGYGKESRVDWACGRRMGKLRIITVYVLEEE
jgi:hypothetical protein